MTPPNTTTPARRPTKRIGRPRGATEPALDRGQIVDAAIRAVRRDGPRVTMTAIAEEAGVTKPIVYRTVGDKQAVAEAVAEFLSLHIEEMNADVIDLGRPSKERFRTAARAYFELLWAERELFLFVEYGWGSHDGRQLEVMIERSAAPFIERAQVFGSNTTPGGARSRTWSYAAIGAMRTVALMWVRNPYCDVDELSDEVTDFVFRSRS